MSEIDKLLEELRSMKNTSSSTIQNTRDIWEKIGNKDWAGAGFADEAEAMAWLEKNEYSNLA
jgi:hypothetical protein